MTVCTKSSAHSPKGPDMTAYTPAIGDIVHYQEPGHPLDTTTEGVVVTVDTGNYRNRSPRKASR